MTATPSHDSHGGHGKKVTVNGLVVIGFFGLVIAGMLLAVYASRYVPETLARLSAAVYLSSDPAKNTTKATTTPSKPATQQPQTPAVVATSSKPDNTPKVPDETGYRGATTPTYRTPTYTVQRPNLYGYPDLVLTNVEAGYIRNGNFIEDDTIPHNRDMYVRFQVRNEGTNIAYGWRVKVSVEGERDAIATGGSLNPNGYQNFTLRVTDPKQVRNLETEIEVDYQNDVRESSESNNDDTIRVDVDD